MKRQPKIKVAEFKACPLAMERELLKVGRLARRTKSPGLQREVRRLDNFMSRLMLETQD